MCTFVLQHRPHMVPRYADGQFRMLQFYADRGIAATNRLARHQIARNKDGSGYDLGPLNSYAALPESGFPAGFPLSVHDLRDADGGFTGDGCRAYGDRMHHLAEATVRAWLTSRPTSGPRRTRKKLRRQR
ncbi:DUF5946 family protein [Nocardia flavorosea]|uniref:DUF5946 family protein n=1 Tax=Nocardia flavorosea TaxID=53429 RepID=UPI002B4ADF4E|nr:DUF5946 family protein [Nocardia flavorosea]